jgi:hypothetical protein
MHLEPEQVIAEVKGLSRLQKKIIYQMVLDPPDWQEMNQRQRNVFLYKSLGSNNIKSARANVSRAWSGLEDALIVRRIQRRYELSTGACQIIAKVLEEFPVGDSENEAWWRGEEEEEGDC